MLYSPICVIQDQLSSVDDVAIVLSLQTCTGRSPPGTCDDVDYSDDLGTTLYKGEFHPIFQQVGPIGAPPYQNFTVFVPPALPVGAAVLSLTHWSLVGVRRFGFA